MNEALATQRIRLGSPSCLSQSARRCECSGSNSPSRTASASGRKPGAGWRHLQKTKQRLSTLLVSDLWSQDRLALALLIAATLLATLTTFLLLLALSLAVFLFLSLLAALTTLVALLTALLSTLAALLALLVLVLLVWHFNYSFV
jgi:hypothetical protein